MDRIRQLRTERGLSQAKLAVMAGMDPATLNRLEQGKGNPNLRTLERVADALGVEAAELLGKAQAPTSQRPLFNNGVRDEERRIRLEEIREGYLASREGLNRYCAHWEQRRADNDLEDRPALREFLRVAEDWYPILLDTMLSEVLELAVALSLPEDSGITSEVWAESSMKPVVDRYHKIATALADVWNERFAKAKAPVVDLEAMRQRHLARKLAS
jgi:transcriptional regulator with XRE-family HTH domain